VVQLDFVNQPAAPPRLCAAAGAELPWQPFRRRWIGTFPIAPEPAGRANPPIAAEPACPPRANEAAGGVKTKNSAIAIFTEVLDMGSTTMIHWNREAVRLM